LQFNLCTCIFELALKVFSFSLVNTFLDGAWCIIYKAFCFFKTQAGNAAYFFNYCNLFAAGSFQDYIKLSLLFGTAAFAATASYNCRRSSRLDTILFFEYLSQFVCFFNG